MPKKHFEPQHLKAEAVQLAQAGDFQAAETLLLKCIDLTSDDAEAWFFLGAVYGQTGRYSDGIRCSSQATYLRPNFPDAHFNLAQACMQQGQVENAINAYQAVLRLQPGHLTALNNLGYALQLQGQHARAIEHHKQAIIINPNNPDSHNHLGNALLALGRRDEAEICFKHVLLLQPGHQETIARLGNIHYQKGNCQEAIGYYLQALEKSPEAIDIHIDLGLAYLAQGFHDLANRRLTNAIEMAPSDARARSAYLFSLNYHSTDGQHIYNQHIQHSSCLEKTLRPEYNATREHRLRVGYISTDFRTHSVAFFILPILQNHNRSQFEITCYSHTEHLDDTTRKLKALSEHWRDIRGYSPEKIADMIRSDRIDILVDLAGHTSHLLLPVFCYRPAPILVTYLGYPNTTGLEIMDYRLTDNLADLPGLTDQWHSEKLMRLPKGFLCYSPPVHAPDIAPSPQKTKGYITFGSFNNLAKVTDEVLNAWSRILLAVPDARIFLKSRQLDDDTARKRCQDIFSNNGIAPERVILQGRIPEQHNHLNQYRHIDIALDTFPYNGTTTTCEALWMGVPVVSFAGNLHAGRVGLSLLTQIGADELVANSLEEYCKLAAQLAGKKQILEYYRSKLRSMLQESGLLDGRNFTLRLEAAYHKM